MALLLSARKKLGILRSEVGTHSICSGAVMAMYLAGVPIFSIMLIGCWPSLAFLKHQKASSRILSQHLIKDER
jgi:hypothetical protein